MTIQNDKNVNATDVNDKDVDVNQQKLNHPENNSNLSAHDKKTKKSVKAKA